MFEFIFEAEVKCKVKVDAHCNRDAISAFKELRDSGDLFKKAEIIDGRVTFIVEKRKL